MSTIAEGQPSLPADESRPQDPVQVPECPGCHGRGAARVGGLCPRCLMGLGWSELAAVNSENSWPELPKKFGRYAIVQRLGQGAMGAVYLAEDEQLGRRVALKVPLFGATSDAAVVQRFEHEVRTAAALRHPNLCPIFDVGELDGVVFMTMAYIEGRPLSERIERGPEIAIRSVVALVRKIAMGLQEAHRRGVIHRDLKPSNIMVDRAGEPIVMDFGLARTSTAADARLTRPGMLVGTPAYMSPEQVAGQNATERSDVYSLGVVLYELLTRRLPFTGDLVPLLASIAHQSAAPPSTLRGAIPPAIDAICLTALAKEPADRFQTMDEFAKALTEFLVSGDLSVRIANPSDPVAPRSRPRLWRRAIMLAATFGIGMLLAVGLLALVAAWNRLPVAVLDSRPTNPTFSGNRATEAVETQENSKKDLELSKQSATTVEDGELNLLLGRYYCLTKGDWQHGLSLLASSSDAMLRSLAKRDLELSAVQPAIPARTVVELADAWRELAERESSASDQRALRNRANHWYELALPRLAPDDRMQVEQWLRDGPLRPTTPPVTDSPSPPAPSTSLASNSSPAPQSVVVTVSGSPQGQGANSGKSAPGDSVHRPSEKAARSGSELPTESPTASAVVSETTETDSLIARSIEALEQIEAYRRKMRVEMTRLAVRRDVGLPQAVQTATSEIVRRRQLRDELVGTIRSLNANEATLRRRLGAATNSATRQNLSVNLEEVRRTIAQVTQRCDELSATMERQQEAVGALEEERKNLPRSIDELNEAARRLMCDAFWQSEPTGSLGRNDYLRMADLFSSWLKRDERHPAMYALRAITLAHAGRPEEAFADAQLAINLDASLGVGWAAQGFARFLHGEETDGLVDLARAIRHEPKSPYGYLLRGLAYQRSGNDAGAVKDFRRVAEVSPDVPWGHAALAWQLVKTPGAAQRDPGEVLTSAQQACTLASGRSWYCLAALAAAQAESRQYAAAVETQCQALQLAPSESKAAVESQLRNYQAHSLKRSE